MRLLRLGLACLVILFLLRLSSHVTLAAIYYVDQTGGNDSNNGLATNEAWKTISKVNGQTYSAGDQILFKKGEIWREQLNPPYSGSAGNPIVFGAYGSGENPAISGADVISGWTLSTGVGTLTVQPSLTDTFLHSGIANTNYGTQTYLLVSSQAGWTMRSLLNFDFSSLPVGSTISSATLSLFYTSFDTSPQGRTYWAYRLTQPDWTETGSTWNKYSGSQSWTSPGGDYTTTGGASTTIPQLIGDGVWVNWNVTSLANYFQANTGSQAYFLIKDGTETGNGEDAYFDSKESVGATKPKLVINYETSDSNIWKIDNPKGNSTVVVIVDGVQYTRVADKVSLTSHTFFNDSSTDPDTIYIYSTDDPDEHTVEISTRDYGIYGTNKQYLQIQDITTYGGSYAGVRFYGNQPNGYNIVDRVTAYDNGVMGIVVDGGQHRNTIRNCTVYGNGNGIYANGDADYTSIIGNTTYSNIRYTIGAGTDGAGIGVYNSNGTVIRNNITHDNQGHGIDVALSGNTGVDVSYNKAYLNGNIEGIFGYGIQVGTGGTGSVSDYRIYYNVAYKNNEQAGTNTCENFVFSGPLAAYNNVAYCDGTVADNIAFGIDGGTVELKNNIAYIAGGTNQYVVQRAAAVTLTSDHNLWFNANGNAIAKDNGTPKTFTGWQGLGYDANSINSNPLFRSVASLDFALQSTSPAIDSGVNVGLTADYTNIQVPEGSFPDIGAYEYYVSVATPLIDYSPRAPSCNDQAPSGIPNLFQITSNGTSVNLVFTTVRGANGYHLSYGTTQNADTYADSINYSGPFWTLSRQINLLSPNSTYYFKVRAVNGCNGSSWSNVMKVKLGKSSFVNSVSKPRITGNPSCGYIVSKGDTLWRIAVNVLGSGKKYTDLMSLNNLSGSIIRPGMCLKTK